MVIHRDRLVLLSFMNPIGNLSTLTGPITPQPFVTLIPEEGNNENVDELTTSTPGLNMALPDVIETRTEETTTLFSTIIHPIVTDPPLSRTTSSPGVTSSKSTTTNTEATSTTSRTTLLPKNSTVRRPTTRTITRNGGSKGRSKAKNLTRISTTTKPSRVAGSGNMTAQSMSLTMNSLADLDHPENLNLELQTGKSVIDIVLYLDRSLSFGDYFDAKKYFRTIIKLMNMHALLKTVKITSAFTEEVIKHFISSRWSHKEVMKQLTKQRKLKKSDAYFFAMAYKIFALEL